MALNIPLVSCWKSKEEFFFFFFINRTKIELQKNQRIIYCYHLEAFRHPNRMSNMSSYNQHLPINIWQLNKLTYCFARTMEMLKIGGEKRDSYSSILFSANCFTFQRILTGYHQCKNLRNNIYLYFSDQSIINRMWRYATIISITCTICMFQFQLNVIIYYCYFFF